MIRLGICSNIISTGVILEKTGYYSIIRFKDTSNGTKFSYKVEPTEIRLEFRNYNRNVSSIEIDIEAGVKKLNNINLYIYRAKDNSQLTSIYSPKVIPIIDSMGNFEDIGIVDDNLTDTLEDSIDYYNSIIIDKIDTLKTTNFLNRIRLISTLNSYIQDEY